MDTPNQSVGIRYKKLTPLKQENRVFRLKQALASLDASFISHQPKKFSRANRFKRMRHVLIYRGKSRSRAQDELCKNCSRPWDQHWNNKCPERKLPPSEQLYLITSLSFTKMAPYYYTKHTGIISDSQAVFFDNVVLDPGENGPYYIAGTLELASGLRCGFLSDDSWTINDCMLNLPRALLNFEDEAVLLTLEELNNVKLCFYLSPGKGQSKKRAIATIERTKAVLDIIKEHAQ